MKNIDFDKVKKLIDYSNSIANIYNELYLLEINGDKNKQNGNKNKQNGNKNKQNGNKNKPDYNDMIKFIVFLKKKEQAIYNLIPQDNLKEYLEYFTNVEKELNKSKAPASKILFSEDKTYIYTRIICTLEYILNELEQSEDTISHSKVIDDFDEWIDDDDWIDGNYWIDDDIDNFNISVANISIIFLDELTKNIENQKLKDQLSKIKYMHSFYNPTIEEKYLLLDFDLNINMVIKDDYSELPHIISYAYSSVIYLLRNILNKETHNDTESFIINLSLLKTYLLFLSDSYINKIISNINAINNNKPEFVKVKTKVLQEINSVLAKNI